MKKTSSIAFVFGAALIALSSCSVIVPVTASRAEIGNLRGESKSAVILGTIYLNGKYGIKDAAENGKITSAIATIDEKTTNFVLFQTKTLIVTGK